MLKRLFIAIILLFTALSLCILSYALTVEINNVVTDTVLTTENYILNNQINLAIEEAEKLKANWENQYKILSSYTSHEDLERTEVAINSVANYLYLEDYSAALIICEDIKICTEHIKNSEKPSFWNIF